MPLEPLEPGSPFPLISTTHTDVWVDFWNIVWKSWIENNSASSGSTSGWPTPFTGNGRIVETEADGLSPRKTITPSLSIVMPDGGKYILGSKYVQLDSDVVIGDLPPNTEGWLKVTPVYDEDFEFEYWDSEILITRPALGAGILGKIKTLSDRVDTFVATEVEADTILTLPLILQRMRSLVGGGEGPGTVYLEDSLYSRADPRSATIVIEEMLAANLEAATQIAESGGIRTGPSDTDQLWNLMLGLTRGVRDIVPESMRFLNVGTVRPGVYGTESAPDTEQFDLGGTLPEVPEDRTYSGL